MICNRCGAAVQPGQKFCADCGQSLKGIADVTEPVPVTAASASASASATERRLAPQSDLPPPTPAPAQTSVAGTEDARRSARVQPTLYDFTEDSPDDLTAELDAPDPLMITVADTSTDIGASTGGGTGTGTGRLAQPTGPLRRQPAATPAAASVTSAVTAPMAPIDGSSADRTAEMTMVEGDDAGRPRFQPTVVSGVGLVVAVLAVVGALTNLVSVESNAAQPAFPIGDWRADEFGTNLMAAALVAIVAIVVGSVASAFHQRWGAGLAGGGALAITGWSALLVGLAEQPIQLAEIAVQQPTDTAFTVTVTRDVGYWLLLAAAVIGVVAFAASLVRSGRERGRSGLNPWIAALGAVAALIAAGGPLIPQGAAGIESNWSSDGWPYDQPAAFLIGRLVQAGVLAFTGVIGFLLVRRYGLALAIGGMTASVWMALTTLFGVGDDAVGPAYTNPGGPLVDVELHAVTIVGMVALVGIATVAVIAAFEQAAHEP